MTTVEPGGTDGFVFRARNGRTGELCRGTGELLTRSPTYWPSSVIRPDPGSAGATRGTRWRSSWPPAWWSCRGRGRHRAAQPARRRRRGRQRRPRHHRAARPLGRPARHPARAGRRRRRGGRQVRPEVLRPAARRRRRRVKIWRADGTDRLLRRDQADRRAVPARRRRARGAARRRHRAEVSDLDRAGEPVRDKDGGAGRGLHPVRSPEGEPLLFEAYYSAADIARQRQQVVGSFQPITLGACSCWSVATPLLWALTRRLDRTGRRPGAAAASRRRRLRGRAPPDRPRPARRRGPGPRRHVVRAVRRWPGTRGTDPDVAGALERWPGALRTSLRALRSLLVEIHPPDLRRRRARGRPRATSSRRPRAAGVDAVVEVYDVEDASDDAVAPGLAGGPGGRAQRAAARRRRRTSTVQVRRSGDRLILDVADDGVGFDRARRRAAAASACGACATWSPRPAAGSTCGPRPATGTTVHAGGAR